MKNLVLVALAASAFLLPLPASATQPGLGSSTDISAQVTVRENRRGGVSGLVGDRPRRWGIASPVRRMRTHHHQAPDQQPEGDAHGQALPLTEPPLSDKI